MPSRLIAPALLTLLALACAPGPKPVSAEVPPTNGAAAPPVASTDEALCAPLLLDADPGFGTHVVIRRLPNAKDIEDMRFLNGLRQIVVALPEWPTSYAEIRPMMQAILPEGTQIVVLLPGWPPSHEAIGAWNLAGGYGLRLILVVDGPPNDRTLIPEINRVRSLERVIAQMEYPSRSGFERLQRPLSFRVLRR